VSDTLGNFLNAMRRPKSAAEQAAERMCCPECGADSARGDLLNNASRCPACGSLVDVESKPRAFT